MQNLNVKVFIYVFLIISAIAWFSIFFIMGLDTNKFWSFIRVLPTVATIDLFLFGLFAKWGWRWKLFQGWLVPFPVLTGTWEGSVQSTWLDLETGEKTDTIPAILTIKQSFSNISCVVRTKEMTSYSYSGYFKINDDNQIRQLTYSYNSNPNISLATSSARHDGTVVMDIIGNPVSKLTGFYWTTRKTTGEMNFIFRDNKILDEIPADLNSHTVP